MPRQIELTLPVKRPTEPRLVNFLRKNTVLLVSLLAAAVSCFFVPPDRAYLNYFDTRTLTCLFCVLAVVKALGRIDFFDFLAKRIVLRFKNIRSMLLALVYITFIFSMFIANDMALLTFLPLGYFLLKSTGREKYMAFVFVMQTVSANLGGMLTPFGNPQNLYLYSYFAIPGLEFLSIMLFPFVCAVLLITACCFFVPAEPISANFSPEELPDKKRLGIYLALFALSILIVFRGIPYYIGLVIIPAALFFLDKKALREVDYGLLLTFCAFFVFSGNIARIPAAGAFLSGLMQKDPLLVGVLSCQVISNVPSAVLLSKFTLDYQSLLVAVNLGGLGTLVSSLASLISFREYTKHNPDKQLYYIGIYSAVNFSLLAILFLLVRLV